VAYAFPEPLPTGLRKFNLGTIPASVTPPRTWRRAAVFAVGTAVLVVLGLGYAAVALVGNPRRGTTINGLPGQPTQHLVITGLPGERAEALDEPQPTSSAPARTTSSAPQPTQARDMRPARPAPAPAPGGRPGAVDPGGAARPDAVAPTTRAPERSTVGPAPSPASDPEKMGDRTEAYYAQVLRHPEAAYRLTAGPMHAEGPEGIEARYADVESIEVRDITIDPNWSFTRSTLVIVRKDGTRTTVHRELTFSHGSDPKITSDTSSG
jgi:hypothetical protein